MGYIIYGKRTQELITDDHQTIPPDKNFKALNARGLRVRLLKDAEVYETKEEAEAIIKQKEGKPGVVFEIRKAK